MVCLWFHLVYDGGIEKFSPRCDERRLGPAFADDRDHFLEGFAIALLVLDRRAVRTAQRLVLARLIAAADAALDASAADHVELRDLLGDAHRMMPDDDIGALAEADLLGLRGDRHLGEQRIGAHLGTFRLEMVLREPERLEPQLLGQDALADLVHQGLLRGGVYLGERAVVHRDPILGDDHRKARRAIVEYTDLEHSRSSLDEFRLPHGAPAPAGSRERKRPSRTRGLLLSPSTALSVRAVASVGDSFGRASGVVRCPTACSSRR